LPYVFLDFSAESLSQADKLGKMLTVREDWKKFKMYRKGKDIRKKRHLAAFVFVPSVFWGEVSNSWILNDIGRNFLVGIRKKMAKCLKVLSSEIDPAEIRLIR
jgi:hypothetical protein